MANDRTTPVYTNTWKHSFKASLSGTQLQVKQMPATGNYNCLYIK